MSTRAHAKKRMGHLGLTAAVALAAAGTLGMTGSAQADVLTINATGITTNAGLGDPANTVFFFSLGAGAAVTGLGYDVTLTAFDPSYLSEIKALFTPSDPNGGAGVVITPAFDQPNSGAGSFSSGGIIDLTSLALNFNVAADGQLRVEFYEGFADASVNPDGIINSGTFTVQYTAVPEPSTWAMAIGGLGVLILLQRRRTRLLAWG